MASRSSRRNRSTRGSARNEGKEAAGSVLRFVLTVAVLAWAFRCLVGAPFSIPSGSMLPTLHIGDYIAVVKWPYGYSRYSFPLGIPSFEGRVFARLPNRGDVVVFRHPDENSDLVKRVVGLPGDTVEVRGGVVILNGRAIARRRLPPARLPVSPNSPRPTISPATPDVRVQDGRAFCLYPAYLETLPGGPSYTVLDQVDGSDGDDFPATRVPAGHLFLMGDNRDDSLDSRFPRREGGIAMVPIEDLIGRATITFWSTDGSASYWKPWTWFSALRPSRIGNGYMGNSE